LCQQRNVWFLLLILLNEKTERTINGNKAGSQKIIMLVEFTIQHCNTAALIIFQQYSKGIFWGKMTF